MYDRSIAHAVKDPSPGDFEFAQFVHDSTLEKHGYEAKTMADMNADIGLSGRLLTRTERGDQWILITSALAGVVLLALSFLV